LKRPSIEKPGHQTDGKLGKKIVLPTYFIERPRACRIIANNGTRAVGAVTELHGNTLKIGHFSKKLL
jgi:hypothetical protein